MSWASGVIDNALYPGMFVAFMQDSLGMSLTPRYKQVDNRSLLLAGRKEITRESATVSRFLVVLGTDCDFPVQHRHDWDQRDRARSGGDGVDRVLRAGAAAGGRAHHRLPPFHQDLRLGRHQEEGAFSVLVSLLHAVLSCALSPLEQHRLLIQKHVPQPSFPD
eukprot:1862297-Rhodomonas_salina.2